jgi:hypothetical protein
MDSFTSFDGDTFLIEAEGGYYRLRCQTDPSRSTKLMDLDTLGFVIGKLIDPAFEAKCAERRQR